MARKNDAEEEKYNFTILSITGDKESKLHLLANASPSVGDPDSITSFVVTLKWSGSDRTTVPLHDMETWATAMDETKKGTLVVVTMDGELFLGRGGKWSTKDLGCPEGVLGVWAAGEDEYFAAGGAGERIRIAGKDVDLSPEPEKRSLNAVHGSSGKDVLIVGDEGAVFRYNGSRWRESDAPTNRNLLAAYCRSEKESYIAGSHGTLFRSDGDDWEKIKAPKVTFTSMDWFNGALHLSAGEDGIFVVGKDGAEPLKELPQPIHQLKTIENYLLAFGGNLLARYDGTGWLGGEMDF